MADAVREGTRERGRDFRLFVCLLFGGTLVARVLWSGVVYPESNALILLLLAALLAALLIGSSLGRGVPWRPSRLDAFVLAYFAIVLALYLFSGRRWLGRNFLVQTAACTAAYLLASRLAGSQSGRAVLLGALCAGVLLVSLYGLYQYYWGLGDTRSLLGGAPGAADRNSAFMSRLYSRAVFSTFFFPNALAGYLAVLLPVTGAVFFIPKRERLTVALIAYICAAAAAAVCWFLYADITRRPLVPLAVVIAAAALVAGLLSSRGRNSAVLMNALLTPLAALPLWALMLTASEGAWGALALSATVGGLVLAKRTGTAVIAAAAIVICAAAGVKAGLAPAGLRDSFETRVEYWRAGARIWAERPVTGAGPGGFPAAYARVRSPSSEEGRMPHSIYLGLASETGVLGLGAFAALWAAFLALAGGEARRGNALCAGACLSALVFLLHGAVGVGLSVPGTTLTLWAFAGMGAAAIPRGASARPLSRVAVMACGLLVTAAAVLWIVPGVRADRARLEAEKAVGERAWESARRASVTAITLDRENPDYWSIYADVCERSGEREPAERAYRRAAELGAGIAPYHFRLAAFYWRASGEGADADYAARARSELEKAVRVNPRDVDYQLLRAFWREKTDRPREAVIEYGAALSLIESALAKPRRIRRHTPTEYERLREMVIGRISELREMLTGAGKETD